MEVCDSFLFQLLTSLENICAKSNFPAGIYSFKVKLAKSRFDDIGYVCVNSIFYSMTLTLISRWVRFPAKILLHCLKDMHLLLHLFIKSCLPGTQGRILLFYFNYKPLFVLPTTHSTLLHFLILHEVVSYCYYIAYDSKACSIFDHI